MSLTLDSRQSSLSNKVTFVWDPTLSPTQHSWSPGKFSSKVGTDGISDIGFRHMEDFVTWVDTSKLKRTIMRYNDEVSRKELGF